MRFLFQSFTLILPLTQLTFASTCIPIDANQPISFQGQGIYKDTANIVGGRFPFTGQTIGTIELSEDFQIEDETYEWNFNGPGYGDTQSGGTITIQESNLSAINPEPGYPFAGYPYNTPGYNLNPYANNQNYGPFYYGQCPDQWNPSQIDVKGSIHLNEQTVQNIYFSRGLHGQNENGSTFFSNPSLQDGEICVSGVAINVGHYNTEVYGGQVYLYLNNAQYGYILYL